MRRIRIVLPAIAAVVTLFVAVFAASTDWPARAYRSGDFFGFWAASRAVIEGASPYDPVWFADLARRSGAVFSSYRSVYPPWTAFALLPFGLLPFALASPAWLIGQLAVVGAAVLLLAQRMSARERPVFATVVAFSQPLWLLVVGGNISGFLAGAVGGSFLAAAAGRPRLAGACFGLVALKPHPFLLVGLAAALAATARERRGFAVGALATAGPLIGAALALRPAWLGEWLGSASALQATTGSNATLWTVGRIVGAERSPLAAAAVIVAITAWALWHRAVRPSLPLAIAGAVSVSLAVAPHGWSYDQLVLLVPLGIIFEALPARPQPERSRRVVLVTLLAVTVPWALYALAFQRGGEEFSVVTPLLVFAAVVVLHRERVAPKVPQPA
ncbi:MAG TPA: glycosyltransferase family 87 protein [Candidatus Limnocylindria bacterium]|nr:glycosyltransferase family 87 protein [Candidatus Limnocylindria bacterium]